MSEFLYSHGNARGASELFRLRHLSAFRQRHGSLGNHDKQANLLYPPFNMNGQRYYTFAEKNVRLFVLDTNRLDRPQLAWFEQALRNSTDDWKICACHHPLYSNGLTHGPSLELRVMLEPMRVQPGVDAVFSGHDHIYERPKPQKAHPLLRGRRWWAT